MHVCATALCPAAFCPARREAERDAATEPLLSSFLYATILAHDSFERALAFVLSNRLANTVMLPTQLFETFYEVLISDADVRQGALADVEACRERVSSDMTSSRVCYKVASAVVAVASSKWLQREREACRSGSWQGLGTSYSSCSSTANNGHTRSVVYSRGHAASATGC